MKDNKVFMSPSEQAEYDRALHVFDNLDDDEQLEKYKERFQPMKRSEITKENIQGELF